MAYDTIDIANYIICKAKGLGITDLSPMKLQKLVYFAHGWNLAINDTPLVNESVQAWQFGPVFTSLYQNFKHYGNTYITTCLGACPVIDGETSEILDLVIEKYGRYTAFQLSNLTHEKGTPWQKVWDGGLGRVIPDGKIQEYFIATAVNG